MAGRSLLEWNLRWLVGAGVTPIWVNLHYRAEEVRSAVEAMPEAGQVRFSLEDPILGTAGAWRKLAREWSTTSLVVCGDNLARFDLAAFAAAHRSAVSASAGRVVATVALFDPARHVHTGIAGSRVRLDGVGGGAVDAGGRRVEGFEEARGGAAGEGLVSTGACLLEPSLAARIPPGFCDFGADVFPSLARDRALAGHVVEDGAFCLGLDTPVHLDRGAELVASGRVVLEGGRASG